MAEKNITIKIKLNKWFFILRDMAETHPENLDLFKGFVIGNAGTHLIRYGEGIRDSRAN